MMEGTDRSEPASMKKLTLLIKPSSSRCQLRCRYCFYMEESRNRTTADYGFMSMDTAAKMIEKAVGFCDEDGEITFMFQGGEPTLIGISWYEDFIQNVEKIRKPEQKICYAIQTNGMLVDDGWILFLKKHDFLVGISIDGYQRNHDSTRLDTGNQKTWNQVIHVYRRCIQEGIRVNVLTVLTEKLAQHPKEYYDFIIKEDIDWIQLIPCLDEGRKTPYTLTPKSYSSFFIKLFDLWYAEMKKGKQRSIGLFDDLVNLLQGYAPGQCGRLGKCSWQYVIEADGSVFPCDFYCTDEWLLGNIQEESMEALTDCSTRDSFLKRDEQERDLCVRCRYRNICHGGCIRQRNCYLSQKYCGHQQLLSHMEHVLYGR